jgi:hypothetical protein
MSEKKSWADIMDEEDPPSIPVTITKHGVKVKKTQVKKKEPIKIKNEGDVRSML